MNNITLLYNYGMNEEEALIDSINANIEAGISNGDKIVIVDNSVYKSESLLNEIEKINTIFPDLIYYEYNVSFGITNDLYNQIDKRNYVVSLAKKINNKWNIICDADEWYSKSLYIFLRKNNKENIIYEVLELLWINKNIYVRKLFHSRIFEINTNVIYIKRDESFLNLLGETNLTSHCYLGYKEICVVEKLDIPCHNHMRAIYKERDDKVAGFNFTESNIITNDMLIDGKMAKPYINKLS